MSSSKSLGIVKLTGILTLVAGIVMIVAGGVTWGMVSSQLRAENITVSETDAPFARGATVAGPISAFAQAEVINMHTIKPIDADCVSHWARKCGNVVTVEEHNVIGGLGDAVAVMDNGRVVHSGRMADLAADEALQQSLLGLAL